MVKINIMENTHIKPVRADIGRLKTTEPTARGRARDTEDASLVLSPSVGQSRREKLPVKTERSKQSPRSMFPVWVPVISSTGSPLMPCRPAYARFLVKSGRAKERWYKGIFAIKMLDRAEGVVQQVAVGVDPGSKREAMTVKSKSHTYLNVLSDAVTWVSGRIEERRNARKARRFRKTPCRQNKFRKNINTKRLAPSTKSRWQIKINILKFLKKLYPITDICVEDVGAAKIKGKRKWNACFSYIEIGKTWFYKEISKLGALTLKEGFETKEYRDILGLKKTSRKKVDKFSAHNVDSWVLANSVTGGHKNPDNMNLFRITPMQFKRRQLHLFQYDKGGIRRRSGGTMSLGLKRGSIVKHIKYGMVYVGGTRVPKRVSLHDPESGNRITRAGYIKDCEFLYFNNWKTKQVFESIPSSY